MPLPSHHIRDLTNQDWPKHSECGKQTSLCYVVKKTAACFILVTSMLYCCFDPIDPNTARSTMTTAFTVEWREVLSGQNFGVEGGGGWTEVVSGQRW